MDTNDKFNTEKGSFFETATWVTPEQREAQQDRVQEMIETTKELLGEEEP